MADAKIVIDAGSIDANVLARIRVDFDEAFAIHARLHADVKSVPSLKIVAPRYGASRSLSTLVPFPYHSALRSVHHKALQRSRRSEGMVRLDRILCQSAVGR